MQGTIQSAAAAAACAANHGLHMRLVRWTMLIMENAYNGQNREALCNFWRMLLDGVKPDRVAFVVATTACSAVGCLQRAKKLHAMVASTGLDSQTGTANALASMLGKCGSPGESRQIFDSLEEKSYVSWNAMVSAYAQNGQTAESLEMFRLMSLNGVRPNRATFLGVLGAVSTSGEASSAHVGEIHQVAAESGYEANPVIGCALLNSYGKCGSLQEARLVFERMACKNLVAWNMIISSYAQRRQSVEVLKLWRTMQVEGVAPDDITFNSVLVACSDLGHLAEGESVHRCISEAGLELDPTVAISVINMYGKCCRGGEEPLCRALRVFEAAKDVVENVVLWNAMVAALTQNGQSQRAIRLYHRMQLEGVASNNFTVSTVLSACTSEGAVREGAAIHATVVAEAGYETWDDVIVSTLLDLYGKCGRVRQARRVFNRVGSLLRSSVFTWTTMMAAYAHNGCVQDTLELCQLMVLEGVAPNRVTFVTALSVCGHAGKLAESLWCWRLMVEDYCIAPIPEHIGCMVHLLGKTGWLQTDDLSVEDDEVSWAVVLQACIERGDTERAQRAALRLYKLEPKNPANYIAMANMYRTTSELATSPAAAATVCQRLLPSKSASC